MPLKPRLDALRREVGKLLAGAPWQGQGAGWLAVWRFDDLVSFVEGAVPRDAPCRHAVALAFVVQKEAERLGITGEPALRAALDEHRAALERAANPPPGTSWQERELLEDALREAGVKAAGLILDAWGAPCGRLGEHPPGGRPPREGVALPPEWFAGTAAPEVAT
jgi:hypothetical protein